MSNLPITMLFSSDILSLSDISDTIKREYLDILDNYKKRIFRNFRITKKIWEIWETYKKRIFRNFRSL